MSSTTSEGDSANDDELAFADAFLESLKSAGIDITEKKRFSLPNRETEERPVARLKPSESPPHDPYDPDWQPEEHDNRMNDDEPPDDNEPEEHDIVENGLSSADRLVYGNAGKTNPRTEEPRNQSMQRKRKAEPLSCKLSEKTKRGVSFRAYTKRQAQKLGVFGWVQNTPRDTVIGAVQGESNRVEEMKEWLKNTGKFAKGKRHIAHYFSLFFLIKHHFNIGYNGGR
ncbi:hypothetical protein GE061_015702 [Apolygus lucorum]|uniref:acylphosphatase n=1 Tax=Apolygus lucorum TaxID=248454 RepID=A0A8S9XLW0_APOLU|nr:hypothetical protein GE061_015702 [Apolygus lucorum]